MEGLKHRLRKSFVVSLKDQAGNAACTATTEAGQPGRRHGSRYIQQQQLLDRSTKETHQAPQQAREPDQGTELSAGPSTHRKDRLQEVSIQKRSSRGYNTSVQLRPGRRDGSARLNGLHKQLSDRYKPGFRKSSRADGQVEDRRQNQADFEQASQ